MQRVNSANGRRRGSAEGISKFAIAQKLFQDIENIIEQEMLVAPAMAASYESNIALIKSKRKRPGLIREMSTKKNRQVVNNMEYDPDTNTWIGNEDVLTIFSPPHVPTITNRNRGGEKKKVGNMTWDPVEKTWRGNEKDVRRFTATKMATIRPGTLGSSAYLQKDAHGMVFDPVSLRWIGNDTEMDIFAQIDKLTDDGFAVGNEFHLSSPLARSFTDCANRHKVSLSGWFADGGVDRKAHLYAIRNMSILRIVRDIKHRRPTYVDLDDSASDMPERDVSSAHASGNGNSADDGIGSAENYDEFDLAGKSLSASRSLPEESDWDKEFEEAANSAVTSPPAVEKITITDDEGWDDAFEETDEITKKLQRGPSFTNLLDVPMNGTITNFTLRNKAVKAAAAAAVGKAHQQQAQQAPAPQSQADEDAEKDLELPSGPLRLAPASKRSEQAPADIDHVAGGDGPAGVSPEPDLDSDPEVEDWRDVDFPETLPPLNASPAAAASSTSRVPLTLAPRAPVEAEEFDLEGLDMEGKEDFVLKPKRVSQEDEDEDDEGFEDDFEIPFGFIPQLSLLKNKK